METQNELLMTKGGRAGERFLVTPEGIRFGRSSSCEIAVKDPSLSRNHCLFELRDGAVWVTDLASANGTQVNGQDLGADSRVLSPGDRVTAGDCELVFGAAPEAAGADPAVDLGLHTEDGEAEEGETHGSPVLRLVLWGAAVAAVGLAAAVILRTPPGGQAVAIDAASAPVEDGPLASLVFEKVEADTAGIYRSELVFADGVLRLQIDDTKENRHAEKDKKLAPDVLARLEKLAADPALTRLDPEYGGPAGNTYRSFTLKIVRGTRVIATSVENAQEPEAFRDFREKLAAFAKNELGMWAVQYSAEKLVEMSAAARREGDRMWSERDVQHGNVARAIRSYEEAVADLETVNPKPADFDDLVARLRAAKAELDRRYRDQNFLVDRAMKLSDWETARRELRVLCDIVPDERDPRHGEANAKLLDVEARQKKGATK